MLQCPIAGDATDYITLHSDSFSLCVRGRRFCESFELSLVCGAGYKMFGRVYMNGDATGKSTHLSVFFVLARGTFDVLQRWPFNQRVTMSLLDQVNARQHVSEAFRPDHSSAAFRRPTGDTNVATGFPKFVPLTALEKAQNVYVRDDTMFIRITVDCRDL